MGMARVLVGTACHDGEWLLGTASMGLSLHRPGGSTYKCTKTAKVLRLVTMSVISPTSSQCPFRP